MNEFRVVLDANIYISGLVFGGTPRTLLIAARVGKFVLCFSDKIREEVERTLGQKFLWPPGQIRLACDPLWKVASHIATTTKLSIIAADPNDDRILECAVDGQADIIASGDGHILRLLKAPLPKAIRHIRILTARGLLDELGPNMRF